MTLLRQPVVAATQPIVAATILMLCASLLQACATSDIDAMSIAQLEDFSELAALPSTTQHVYSQKPDVPRAADVLNAPVGMRTTGQATGIIHSTCLTQNGIDYISAQLDSAVLDLSESLNQQRVGLDHRHYVSNQVTFFAFDSPQQVKAAQAKIAQAQLHAARKEAVIVIACRDANSMSASIVAQYARAYMGPTKYGMLAVGIAEYAQADLNGKEPNTLNRITAAWHHAARRLTDHQSSVLSRLRPRDTSNQNMTQQDVIMARSFAAYVITRYGMSSAMRVIEEQRPKDGFNLHTGRRFDQLKSDWLNYISRENRFAQL